MFHQKKHLVIIILIVLFAFNISSVFAEDVTLRILCWKGYSKPYIEGFQKLISEKYNINVTIEISNVSDPTEFWQKSRAKKVDLISPAHNILKSNKWPFIKGTVNVALPINLDNIPNYKYVLPFLQKSIFVTENNSVYGVPYTMGPYGLAYNADKVAEPKSWNVLWSDKSKNTITLSKDYSDCNIYISALALGAKYDQLYDYDKLISRIPKKALEVKLKKLALNTFSFWEGTANYKEFPKLTYAATWGYAVAQANINGGNWKMADPQEGTTLWVDHWVITYALKDKPLEKKLAEEWINYCLSPELQVGVIRYWGVSPVVTNINDKLTKSEISIYKPGQNDYWRTLSLWENQTTRTSNGYINMWRGSQSKNQICKQ